MKHCSSITYHYHIWKIYPATPLKYKRHSKAVRYSFNIHTHIVWFIAGQDFIMQCYFSRWLRNVSCILFINKIDLLEEKIRAGHTLDDLINNMDPNNVFYNLFAQYKNFPKPKGVFDWMALYMFCLIDLCLKTQSEVTEAFYYQHIFLPFKHH